MLGCEGIGMALLGSNSGGLEIHQLLFADDTVLVADSKEKLCRLENEFGKVLKEESCVIFVVSYDVLEVRKYGSNACEIK